MNLHPLSDTFFTAAQVSVANVELLANHGVTTLVCNLPDGETANGETSADVRQAAEKAGMGFHYLPVVHGHFDPSNVSNLRQILAKEKGKIVGYCRSGARSANLWSMAQ